MSAARMLRYARRRADMTQRALADASGVPQSSIARMRRRHHRSTGRHPTTTLASRRERTPGGPSRGD
ncbi:MAG: helix-turn-helix transcriptional regulator [Chloroflexi bacterium]|nr:helix-turn-helix transcriptional regulator [Chloroflexota bacterium]